MPLDWNDDMYSFFVTWLETRGLDGLASPIAYAVCIFIGIAGALVLRKVVRALLIKFFSRGQNNRSAILIKNKFFAWFSNLAVPIALTVVVADIGTHQIFWHRTIAVLLVLIVMFLLDSLIRSIGDIYNLYEVSKTVPIRGPLQILEIAVFIVGAIVLISIFVDRSPLALLSGLGAMTAIVTIVFKDAILGFVAGIQITANDLVRVGDMIEMPQRHIGGTVQDISLMTVKVEGFDKTIVAIPAYAFVSEPFVNRRGIADAGARRIMRSFNIDANTVRVCDKEMLAKFEKMPLLAGRVLPDTTNIGVFREYLTAYLRNRVDIRQDLTLLVRQLTAADVGIPFEVFAFATAVDLVPFEGIQSDIFDHIYAVIPEFGLRLYQRPSGFDMHCDS